MLSIDNFNATDLNRNVDKDFIFKSKSKEVELTSKEINRANVYKII